MKQTTSRTQRRPASEIVTGALVLAASVSLPAPVDAAVDPLTVHVFNDDMVHFLPDDPSRYARPEVTSLEDGRVIRRRVELTPPEGPCRIIARVTTHPLPMDIQNVHDKWDRGASLRLVADGAPTLEIVRFITAYGGETDHEVDVTYLAPLLRGSCTLEGSIDTWVSPAWRMDVSLTFRPIPDRPDTVDRILEPPLPPPDVAVPVFYHHSLDREAFGDGPLESTVSVPTGLERVSLYYLVTGHCTDGRGADEFEKKTNVITVDGEEVHRFEPWRDDCRELRDVNPYCRRWSDGSWSADYSRSGWCPGDWVRPTIIDVTDAVSGGGEHRVGVMIENVRPEDESGKGVWHTSGVIVGWRNDPMRVEE